MLKPARVGPILLCGLLLSGAGCARTDDGTVVIPRPVDARRIWDKGPAGTQTPPVESGSNVFPLNSPAYRRPAPPAGASTRRAAAGPATVAPAEPTAPISCGPATDAGGRVRMVCE
ncbi:hypothetical protein [Aquamicrobium ahrensii]|uniref:Lipoprotein n=1 Tax=Aquamicrobium ahrensii TaxID=469551 RepID=A0ABV2KNQ0_9HYPH